MFTYFHQLFVLRGNDNFNSNMKWKYSYFGTDDLCLDKGFYLLSYKKFVDEVELLNFCNLISVLYCITKLSVLQHLYPAFHDYNHTRGSS